MPELGMGLVLTQQLRLEERLQLVLAQRLDFSDEKEYREQREVLEAMRSDLDDNVYSDTADFSNRVMKRIKKKQRTDAVTRLVSSLRKLIEAAEPQRKEVYLDTISQIVDLGLTSVHSMHYAETTFNGIRTLSGKINNPLHEIVDFGTEVTDEDTSPSDFYRSMATLDERIEGLTPQAGYDRFASITRERKANRKIVVRTMSNVITENATYNAQQGETFFELLDELGELAVPHDTIYTEIPVQRFVSREDPQSLQEKYPAIPLSLLAELAVHKASEATLQKMQQYASNKHVRDSRDNKRAFLGSVATIRRYRGLSEVEDILQKAEGMREARDILALFSSQCKLGIAKYNPALKTGKEIMAYLQRRVEYESPVLNVLSPEALDKFKDIVSRNLPHEYHESFLPILKLGECYGKEDTTRVALLAEVMARMLNGTFQEYRYSGEIAEAQLAPLYGNTEKWRENKTHRRILGDVEKLELQYQAVVRIAEGMKATYKEVYKQEAKAEHLTALQEERVQLNTRAKEHTDREEKVPEEISARRNEIDEQNAYGLLISELSSLPKDAFSTIPAFIQRSTGSKPRAEFKTDLEEIVRIARSEEVSSVKHVTVRDTDNPNYMLEIGRTPKQSCQRWNEKTGQNHCLPAYVADANKRLVQVLDERGLVRVRSIYRLQSAEELPDTPVLFVEMPYADVMSRDLLKSAIGAVVEKAYAMSEETGLPIAVAAQDKEYCDILKAIAKGIKEIKYKTITLTTTFAPSRNGCEYSDGFGGAGEHGGVVQSGQKVSATKVGYIILNHENN